MSDMFGWQLDDCYENGVYVDDATGDVYVNSEDDTDKYEDEDDEFLNSNDPLRKHRRPSLYEANPGQSIAVIGAMLDESRGIGKTSSDKAENSAEESVEYVSMQDHLGSGTTAKRPLKPFEQWVDDVLHGRKTYDDPL